MTEERIKSFDEFYPFYLGEHVKKGTRVTHFIGTTLFLGCLALAIINLNWMFLLAGVVLAYGFAWVGHFFVEHNKPATFKYPLWSLMSDFKLYFQIWAGKESFGR